MIPRRERADRKKIGGIGLNRLIFGCGKQLPRKTAHPETRPDGKGQRARRWQDRKAENGLK
jgi:hypothetical protein